MTKRSLQTALIHGQRRSHPSGEPVSIPIVTATSFHTTADAVGFSAAALNDETPLFYARWANPTVNLLEERLAYLEDGAGAVAFGSGMGAISALFLERLSSGQHLVISDVCYAGAAELVNDLLPRYGIQTTVVDTSRPELVAAAIKPGITKLVHIETPANPILRVTDIRVLADIAHAAGAQLSVDSTIATPVATRPITLGADFTIHSLTKYMCGHGDALGGAVVARSAHDAAKLRQEALVHFGGVLSPFSAWLILRGLETLAIRMVVHERNALQLATFLEQHPKVGRVNYPGLESHPQHALARRQMSNFSGLLSFTLKDDSPAMAQKFSENLKTFAYAVSIGKTKSLLFYIPTEDILRSSFKLDVGAANEYRRLAGDGVFRLSAGLEDAEDLIEDLQAVLDAA